MSYQEHLGTYGTTRQSWKEDKPRALLVALYEKHKTYSTSRLLAKFLEEVIDDKEYLEPIIETWFTNAMSSLKQAMHEPNNNHKEKLKAEIQKAKEKIQERMVMLALVMPNGKTMRFCTGSEMQEWGGWYAKIGKKVGGKMVGQVLSEEEIWSLRER